MKKISPKHGISEKENLIPECLQQTNNDDGGNPEWYLAFWNNDCQGLQEKYQWSIVVQRLRNRTKAFYGKISSRKLKWFTKKIWQHRT